MTWTMIANCPDETIHECWLKSHETDIYLNSTFQIPRISVLLSIHLSPFWFKIINHQKNEFRMAKSQICTCNLITDIRCKRILVNKLNEYPREEVRPYTMAETARQYLSHILRNLGWPPISHNLIVTFPLVNFLILNPTYQSSENDNILVPRECWFIRIKHDLNWRDYSL